MQLSSTPYVPHVSPISLFLAHSPYNTWRGVLDNSSLLGPNNQTDLPCSQQTRCTCRHRCKAHRSSVQTNVLQNTSLTQIIGTSLSHLNAHEKKVGLKVWHPGCVRSIIQSCSVYIYIYIYIYTYSHETQFLYNQQRYIIYKYMFRPCMQAIISLSRELK